MAKHLKLNNGFTIPTVGLGMWLMKKEEVKEAIVESIKAGYRHIDCAWLYGNESSVGDALQYVIDELKLVKREDLFITSKLWSIHHRKEYVRPAVEKSLADLKLKYLDLYLIHTPISFKSGGNDIVPVDAQGNIVHDNVDHMETWKAMEDCVKDGLVRSIGLSTFSIKQTNEILKRAEIKPAVMQIEVYPYFQNKQLIEFCVANDISVVGFSCLGSFTRPWDEETKLNCLEDKLILKLSDKYKRSPAQIILRWVLQKNIGVLAKSSNPKRIKENIDIFDFNVSEDDVLKLDALERGMRMFGLTVNLNGHFIYGDETVPYNPFFEE